MTNEIKTRRLIVSVPNVSGDEIDALAADIEREVTEVSGLTFTVRHALGETLPVHVMLRQFGDTVGFDIGYQPRMFNQSELRSLAGALLAAADQLAEGTPS